MPLNVRAGASMDSDAMLADARRRIRRLEKRPSGAASLLGFASVSIEFPQFQSDGSGNNADADPDIFYTTGDPDLSVGGSHSLNFAASNVPAIYAVTAIFFASITDCNAGDVYTAVAGMGPFFLAGTHVPMPFGATSGSAGFWNSGLMCTDTEAVLTSTSTGTPTIAVNCTAAITRHFIGTSGPSSKPSVQLNITRFALPA